MPTIVEVNGEELEFPDSMSDEEIKAVLDEQFSTGQPELTAQGGGPLGEVLGGLETAGTIVSSAIAEPIAGLAGLSSGIIDKATGKPFQGGDVVEMVRDALTYDPRTPEGERNIQRIGQFLEPVAEAMEAAEETTGEVGFEAGGPFVGALASALPALGLELLGYGAPKAAAKIAKSRAGVLSEEAGKISKQADDMAKLARSEDLESVVEQISRADIDDMAEIVDLDPAFIKASDELGVDVEPLASFASKNPQFRSIEQALSAIPGSELDAQGRAFVGAVSKKADTLIERYGGTLDKANLSERFRQETFATIDQLFEQADELYNKLDNAIPKTTSVNPTQTLAFINKKGLEGKLPPLLAEIKKDLTPETKRVVGVTGLTTDVPTKQATFGRLAQLRRDVGQAIQKGTGPFKDAETGLLKAVYSRMRTDQDNVAKARKIFDVSKAADGLVVQRKMLEDSMKRLLGNKLSGTLTVKGGTEIRRLVKQGDIQRFKEFVNDVPEAFRQEVVVSALNDIFKGRGVSQQALNVTEFSKLMDDLDRQPTLKNALYSNLPSGAGRDLDNLHKLAKGISVAQQDKVRTGIVTTLFDEQTGLLRKMIGKGAQMAVGGAVAKTTGSPLLASVTADFLSARTSKSQAVGDLLASDQFRTLITDSVRSGVIEGGRITRKLKQAEKLMEKSEKYKAWADTLSESEKAQLASVGLISYLLDEQEVEENVLDSD